MKLQNAPSFTNYATISFYYKVGSPFSQAGSGTQIVVIIIQIQVYNIAQKNNKKELWMRGGGANITTYNTAIRDNGALPSDDFVLITYIYNGDTSSFDLYFGGKYYGICPIFINQNRLIN